MSTKREKIMFRLLIALMLVVSFVRVANAEDYYVKIYGGLANASFSEDYGMNNNSNVKTSGSEFFYGGAFGGYINDDFSLEFAIEKIDTDLEFTNNAMMPAQAKGTVDATLAFINGYYHFNEMFYVGAGIGGGDVKFDVPVAAFNTRLEDTIEEKLPYQAIVGYKIALTDTIDLDTRLRYLVIDTADITTISTGLRFNF